MWGVLWLLGHPMPAGFTFRLCPYSSSGGGGDLRQLSQEGCIPPKQEYVEIWGDLEMD